MDHKRLLFYSVSFVSIGLLCTLLFFSDFLVSAHWVHCPFHYTIETFGGIASILIALVLYQQSPAGSQDMFFMVATGFACMGVLDMFHAMSEPGEAFVFLHSAASLAGGFFFALTWLPSKAIAIYASKQRWIVGIAIFLSFSIGIRAMLFPENIPRIVYLYDGQFTLAAILINTCASLLFLGSAPRFFIHYHQFENPKSLIFIFLSLQFGLSEMIFQFSWTWNGIWWIWHFLRLTAFMVTLSIISNEYMQLVRHWNNTINGDNNTADPLHKSNSEYSCTKLHGSCGRNPGKNDASEN